MNYLLTLIGITFSSFWLFGDTGPIRLLGAGLLVLLLSIVFIITLIRHFKRKIKINKRRKRYEY